MNILFISHFFPPLSTAGTENYTFGVARALMKRGHAVTIACAGDWQKGDAYWNGVTQDNHAGIPVYRAQLNWTRARNPNRALYDSPEAAIWIQELLAELRPNLVHVTSAYSLGVGVLRAVRDAGIPLVLTLTDFWFVCPRTTLMRSDSGLCSGCTSAWECQQCLLADSGWYRRTEWMPVNMRRAVWEQVSHSIVVARRRGARGLALDMDDRKKVMRDAIMEPDLVLAPSRFVQQVLAQTGVCDRVVHFPHGHELSWLDAYQGKVPTLHVRFAYAGQIAPHKGVHLALRAFLDAELAGRATLDIWGRLDQRPEYAAELRALIGNVPDIRLRGPFNRNQLAQVFSETDALIVPSLWYENAPLVIQEAFAARIPVIATRLGGMAEAVQEGVNGLLFTRGDSADLGRKLMQMVEEPELLAKLTANTPRVLSNEEEVTSLEEIYARLMERAA